MIGARPFLIAYNVNINTRSVRLAKEIAFTIRESGRVKRDASGNKVLAADGTPERVPGIFECVQATGWLIPEYGRAQITINILDIDKAPLHEVFDVCCELAEKNGCRVTGSEIVGMVPRRVMIETGLYYLKKQRVSTGVSQEDIIRTAVQSLGLCDVSHFDPAKKIIEERFRMPAPLASMTVSALLNELASDSPAPGGGSVAALAGALSAGLSSMVAALTYEKKGFESAQPEMERVGISAQDLMRDQTAAIDSDTAAFNKVMDAFALPKETEEQKAARKAAIEQANKGATLEPLATLERTIPSLDCALAVAERGNPNSLSDAGVAGLMGRAAAMGAYYNVLINLSGIKDEAWSKEIREKADGLIATADEKAAAIEKLLLQRLKN